MAEKLNFTEIEALLVDADPYFISILTGILRGFGLIKQTVVNTGEDAKTRLARSRFDLVICDIVLPDMAAVDLVRWVRRQADQSIKYVPIVIVTGYTQMSNVLSARDCGANSVVKKPMAPNVLFDHIVWSAKTERPYIESGDYIGPCRRFKNIGPPEGVGRRHTDLSAEIGEAKEPNLSQDEIDAFLKPTKVVI